jgi:hypothetical protein
MPSLLRDLRVKYHRNLCGDVFGQTAAGHYNTADKDSPTSVALAAGIAARLPGPFCPVPNIPKGQTAGARFAAYTTRFIEDGFALLRDFRPGDWIFSAAQGAAGITAYEQYRHLADLDAVARAHPEVRAALGGDYLITPDIIVGRRPVPVAVIDSDPANPVVGDAAETHARLTPLRADNPPNLPSLHASISCKWTMRSDRAQNTRTEALNLLRNRKGRSPQMIVVTAEPLPSRLMSIAVGTGDIDCCYHSFLSELVESARAADLGDQLEMLDTMISGRRLRDISDLPFDLAL